MLLFVPMLLALLPQKELNIIRSFLENYFTFWQEVSKMNFKDISSKEFTPEELVAADIWLNQNKIRLLHESNMALQIHQNFLEYKDSLNQSKRISNE
jgi:hypothetical protein